MRALRLDNCRSLALLIFLLRFTQKCRQSNRALAYINQHRQSIERDRFVANDRLNALIRTVKYHQDYDVYDESAPAIMMLNQYALNVTLNFLCNVQHFRNVHNRLILFAFDAITRDTIAASWPTVLVIYWPIEALQDRFTTGDGRYQLFQIFRANIATYLSEMGIDFWMIQADTYWRANLFDRVAPALHMNSTDDVLFDREGDAGLLADMIAGGNFFVRGNLRTMAFFAKIAETLHWLYTTDNNLMGAQCTSQYANVKCAYIPYRGAPIFVSEVIDYEKQFFRHSSCFILLSTMSNWRWHRDHNQNHQQRLPSRRIPLLLQFDGGNTPGNDKFAQMTQLGVAFVEFNRNGTPRCIDERCRYPETSIDHERLLTHGYAPNMIQRSLSFFHCICEVMYAVVPSFGIFLRSTIFPMYAYYFMI